MSRAMTVPWSLLWILGLICSSDSSCSPTSYYKSCWIRRFPGLYVDIEESQRRGAHVLKVYQEETALKCSRACCLTRNFSCNLAVFHFNTTQDSVNCFHLQCPTLESCIPQHRGNVILYNVTKGVDPDLLVFGKYFTTNVRVLPHMSSSRLNVSEPLTSDKRHFNYPPNPPVRSISPASTSTKQPTTPQQATHAGPTARDVQCNLPQCTTVPTQSTSGHVRSTTSQPKTDSKWTSTPQWASTNLRHTAQMDEPDTTDTLNQSIPNPSPVYTSTAHPSSTIDSTLTSIPINETPSSSTIQQALGLQTTLATISQNTMQSFTKVLTSTQKPLTRNTEQATSLSNSKSTELEEYPQTTTPTIVVETVNTQTSAFAQSKTSTTTSVNVPLQTTTRLIPAIQPTTQITSERVLSTTLLLKTDPTLSPHQMTTTQQLATTKPLTSANFLLQTLTQIIPETSAWPLQTPTQATTLSQPKETTSKDTTTLEISTTTSPTITTGDTTTPRHLTQSFTRTRMGNSATTGSLSSSLIAPTSRMVDSQPYPNDTKGYLSWNVTTGDAPRPVEDGSLTSVWHLAANTVLVALATCATITFGCCCSVFVALSWRGRRRRKGRYRTNLRGKRGSMRLIKYVIVRESS